MKNPEWTFIITSFMRHQCVFNLVESIREYYPKHPIMICNYDGQPLEVEGANVIQERFDIGLSAARNRLVNSVKTEYVVLLDDDFIFTQKTKVEKLINKLKKNHLDIVAGALWQDGNVQHYEGVFKLKDKVLTQILTDKPPYDFVFNFFAAKTKSLKSCPWDELQKIAEHTCYFYSHWGKLKIGYEPTCVVTHEPDKSGEYFEYRKRALKFTKQWLRRYGLKMHISPYGRTFSS